MGSTLKRSGILVVVAAGLLAGMLATSATVSAFTVPATSIFKVATYSSTIPVDGSGRGWLGMAFSPTGVLYATAADGNLYVASASGPAPVTMSLVGAVGAGASGLAFGLDGKLYATTSAGVLEISPATATTIRVLAPAGSVSTGIPGPDGLAIDPVSGDLFVTSSWFVYWIATPSAPVTTAVIYTSLRSTATVSHGISINTEGTLYVTSDVQIWRVTNPHALPSGVTSPTPEPIVAGTGLRGVAVVTNNVDTVARFVFTNNTAGAITRYPVPPAGGDPAPVVTSGDRGDFMTVGPDHCAYAAQGGAILRVSRDDGTTFGTCDLVASTTPPATMTLAATGGSLARVGALQTFQAAVQNAPLPDGTLVTFTVTGANPQVTTVTAISGHATLGYAATTAGTDTITASTAIAGGLTSNTVTVVWGPAFDPIPPVIKYTVSGDHGVGFACVVSTTLDNTDSCGFYTTAPTVTWTVTPGGTAPLDTTHPCLPFTLTASTGPEGLPVTCQAANADGASSSRTVVLQALLTPPQISAAMISADGHPYVGAPTNQNVIVTFTCTDDAGPTSIQSCSLPMTVANEGAGQTVTGNVVDKAGRSVSVTFGPINLDKTPPTISVAATLPGGALYHYGDWTNQNVALTYQCADAAGPLVSGIASCPADTVIGASQLAFSATAMDAAGNARSVLVGAVNIDKTPPTVTATATAGGVAYSGAAPTNAIVVVSFPCSSDGAPVVCPPAQSFSGEGTFTASATLTDAAGNIASGRFGPFSIDKTPPTISVSATLPGGALYNFGDWTGQDVTLAYGCADASGIASCPATTVVSAARAAFSATAIDAAGNPTSITVGPINIDKTPPTISATATAGGLPYAGAVPTNQTVVVTFNCTTDGAPVSCPPSQTFSAEGTFATAPAVATDAAGNTASAAFGPFSIDKTPPTISVSATLPGAVPYAYGSWTNQNVTLTYSCADALGLAPSGIASCPTATIVSASQAGFTATARDAAGNSAAALVGAINIDKTPPLVNAVVTPAPDANGNYVFHATVTLTATDPAGVASITYSATGAQPIGSTTVSGTATTFTFAIDFNLAGTTTVTYYATDAAGNTSLPKTAIVTIVFTQDSFLTITSPSGFTQGSTVVTARLVGPGGIPVVGRTVTFSTGLVSAMAVTGPTGTATATLTLAPGQYNLSAIFAGDSGFYPSHAGPQNISVGAATQFVIWGGNSAGVQVDQRVVFWGEHWWDQVNLAEKSKVKDFKGWASIVSGKTWTTKAGNSKPPETLPMYISVIITTNIDRGTGEDAKGITGTVNGHAILRVDSPYKDEPSKPVYGVVVALLP